LDACLKFSKKSAVSAADLASSLAVSEKAASSFLLALGLKEESASCSDLCRKTVASVSPDLLPPTSDVACHMRDSKKICDIDVSRESLAGIAKQSISRPQRKGHEVVKEMTAAEQGAMAAQLAKPREASFEDLQIRVANWFGVWPMNAAANGGAENQAELDALANAYVVQVLQGLSAGELNSMVEKWFGASGNQVLNLVRDGVVHIQSVMQSPWYINHPDEEGYYGWVLSPYEQASNGTWPIHLGGAYFAADTANRVGTLTHEASHFYPLGTWDRMYCDVPGCLDMARDRPKRARENADHFSFFIDEVVGGGMA